ncbi:MAG: uroporphyrinogen decarboxylase family protein [Bacteroidota bacterium]
MTPRERWLALFARERPDRIPTDYWATDEVTARLLRDLRCADIEALYCHLHIDGIIPVEPPRTVEHHPDDPLADIWGLRKNPINYGTGVYEEFANHPLESMTEVEELDRYKWPSADDHDYEAFRRMLMQVPGHRLVRSCIFEPFLIYCAMRGLEQAMMDLVADPDFVMTVLNYIFEYHYKLAERTFEIGKGRVEVTYVAEDLGGQTAPLMSLPLIRKFFLPNQKKMADLAKSFGIHVFYHTDGAVREIIPDLINVTGIELLNPIQWRCPGMERQGLVKDFGDKIIFHGAMDNQQTLPFGTVEDVKNEVLENIQIFRGARWVCAPCHNLQPVTSTQKIVAMYETIHNNGSL